MSPSASCSCEQLPLLKILLHAAKYPQCTVNGVLLGSASSSGVTVADAVPLFHCSGGLSAPTEVALAQVEAYAHAQGESRSIVGYYHSDARMQSADIGPISRRVADQVAAKYPRMVMVLLDNRKLASFVGAGTAHPFEVFGHEGKTWRRESPEQLTMVSGSSKTLQEAFSGMLSQNAHRLLVDFDEHLDDVSKDWCNPGLATMGKTKLPGQA